MASCLAAKSLKLRASIYQLSKRGAPLRFPKVKCNGFCYLARVNVAIYLIGKKLIAGICRERS